MFTPQRRLSSAIVNSGSEVPKNGGADVDSKIRAKGKAVAFFDGGSMPSQPPPPVMSLGGDGVVMQEDNMEDWMRFREAGLLDEAVMERKDRQALLQKTAKLEKELYDYQYTMGLLLIEKKEWNSKIHELSQGLAEAQEIFKREQAAHIIAYSEAEDREENFRKALNVEKKKATELQRVLRELQEEHLRIKNSSVSNFADVKALAVGIEERSVEVEAKICAADAKLDEINHKSSELDRKLEEVEARESVLQRECLSLNADKEAHEATFYRQREDLLEWEKKLQKREDKLCELRKTLNQKEERVNENERAIKQKARDLEEAEKKITSSSAKLKQKQDDIANRLSDLAVKEEKADSARRDLEMKEGDLLSLEEKLCTKEKMEVQQIVDERRATLDVEIQELELELSEKKKDLDEELRSKASVLGQKEAEILHREEKLRKREQALDKKSERVKEKEKDIELKLKNVKATQKSVNAEQKKLELEQRKLLADKESLLSLKNECENIRSEISQQELQIGEESEKLKVTNDERIEHLRMQAELKLELEKCKLQEEYLLKEGEELKEEREKFEKELNVLVGKRDQLSKELKEITKEKEKLEKLRRNEEEKMKRKRVKVEESIRKELEALRLEKESFELRKKHEQMALSEKAATLHDQIVQEFEPQRSNFETESRSKKEELEKELLERERSFERCRERELNDLKCQKDVVKKELEEIQSQKPAIKKEIHKVAETKEEVGRQQIEMRKDIDELARLCDKLRGQREQLMREKDRYLKFVEKHKGCKNCGDITGEFILSDFLPPDIEEKELAFIRGKADKMLSNDQVASIAPVIADSSQHELDSKSGERVSWLRRCTSKIFSISPTKKILSSEMHENNVKSAQPDDNNNVSDESKGISVHIDKPTGKKRDWAESEHGGGNSDGCSDSVTTYGRRKKRKNVVPVVTPSQTRYNLRRHKIASTVKTEKKGIDDSVAAETKPEIAAGIASETEKFTTMNVTTTEDVDIFRDKEDKLHSTNIVERVEEVKSVEITELSDEVNDEGQCADEGDIESSIFEEEDDSDDDDYDPGEASMGKKIWTFFTS